MGFRKVKSRKKKGTYAGVQEYFRDSDHDKATVAHYISYWVADPSHTKGGTTKKERVDTLDPNEALEILQQRQKESKQKKIDREELQVVGSGAVLTIDQVATEYFHERKKVGNLEKDMKRYVKHIGTLLYKTITVNRGRGYELTPETKTYEAWTRSHGIVTRPYRRKDDLLSVGSVIIKDLEPNVLMRLISALEKKDLSPKTIASIMNLLKAIVNHAISEGYIIVNPFLNKKSKVNVPKEDRKRLFTQEEIKDVFIQSRHSIMELDKEGNQVVTRGKKCWFYEGDKRVFLLLKMLYYTAQRPKSIIELRVRDIDLEQRLISIDAIKGQSGTSVPISPKLYPLLKLWIKGCDADTKLFNIGYVTFRHNTAKLFQKYNAGLDYKKHRYMWVSMYTFRHTSATVILAKTGNMKMAQTILGHSDPRMTATYAKLLDDAKRGGINVL